MQAVKKIQLVHEHKPRPTRSILTRFLDALPDVFWTTLAVVLVVSLGLTVFQIFAGHTLPSISPSDWTWRDHSMILAF